MTKVKYFTYDDDGLVVVYENEVPAVPREEDIIWLRNDVYRIVHVFWSYGDASIWIAEERVGYGNGTLYADIYKYLSVLS